MFSTRSCHLASRLLVAAGPPSRRQSPARGPQAFDQLEDRALMSAGSRTHPLPAHPVPTAAVAGWAHESSPMPVGQAPVLDRGSASVRAVGLSAASASRLNGRIRVDSNIVYEDVNGRQEQLDVYLPAGPAPAGGWPVLLAIHGGGWRRFDKDSYGRMVANTFTPAGYAVVSINYLLSTPGSPSWPANFEDVRTAARWIKTHAAEFGFDPDRVAAIGESAGAHLAALLGTDPDGPLVPGGPADPGGVSAAVQAVIDFYGPTDLTTLDLESRLGGLAAQQLLGGTPAQIPALYEMASPDQHVSSASAPMLVIQGTADPVVPVDQSESLASDLTAAGVRNQLILIPGATHGFGFQVGGRNLVPQMLAFLTDTWNDRGSTFSQP
jgi:acetyl esterase/lipase